MRQKLIDFIETLQLRIQYLERCNEDTDYREGSRNGKMDEIEEIIEDLTRILNSTENTTEEEHHIHDNQSF